MDAYNIVQNTEITTKGQKMSGQKLAVIMDGSSFIYRAFFACPQMQSPEGRSVGAVHGFCTMLLSQLSKHDSDIFCVAMDCGRHTFRLDMYPEYKATREATPDDLKQQLPLMTEACRAFGLPTLSQPGFEADDIIASYSKSLSERGYKVRIVGIDKDLYQLVSDNVEIFDPVKSKTIGRDEVVGKYGVFPEQMIDFQAIVGDKADNVPGVKGIGPIGAAKLLNTYGTLEAIYENINYVLPLKARERLLTYKADAEISKKLVTLNKNVKIFEIFPSIKFNYDQNTAYNFLASLGFSGLINRMYKTAFYAKNVATFLQQPSSMLHKKVD